MNTQKKMDLNGLYRRVPARGKMSWKPELSWTCPPRVVFDVLDRWDSIQQPRGHCKYPGWRKKGGRQTARARTMQRAPAGKARRSGRPKPSLRQTKTNNSQGRMDGAEGRKRLENKLGPKKLSIGRVAPTIIPLLCWEGPRLSVASVHWVEGVSRPSLPEKDRPSKRKLSNSIPRWLPIGRTPRLCARVAHWANRDTCPYLAWNSHCLAHRTPPTTSVMASGWSEGVVIVASDVKM